MHIGIGIPIVLLDGFVCGTWKISRRGARRTTGASEAYRDLIELELSRGRNAMGIWQDLVDGHGFTGVYQSVQRWVRKLRGAVSPEARVIIETRPGEECQVDYGTGPMVRDADSGKYRRTRLFVLTLGYSRKSVRQRVSVWVQDLLWGLPAAVFFNWTAGSTCSRLGRSQ